MTKNEFNIGDKVVAKRYYDIDVNGYSTTIPIGEVGVVEDFYADEMLVSFGNYGVTLMRPISEFESTPKDRKSAFLTELQALLRKYDAVIDIAADYGYSVGVSLSLNGEEVIHDREVTELHADNIMDFSKE